MFISMERYCLYNCKLNCLTFNFYYTYICLATVALSPVPAASWWRACALHLISSRGHSTKVARTPVAAPALAWWHRLRSLVSDLPAICRMSSSQTPYDVNTMAAFMVWPATAGSAPCKGQDLVKQDALRKAVGQVKVGREAMVVGMIYSDRISYRVINLKHRN